MRHAGEVGDDRLAADVLAQRQRQGGRDVLVVRAPTAARAGYTVSRLGVGQLDADDVAARHGGDARRHRAHRAGDVVGQADHAARLGAGRRLQLVERHHRAGPDLHDLALDAEIVEHRLQQAGVLLAARPRRSWSRPRHAAAATADRAAAAGSRRRGRARAGRPWARLPCAVDGLRGMIFTADPPGASSDAGSAISVSGVKGFSSPSSSAASVGAARRPRVRSSRAAARTRELGFFRLCRRQRCRRTQAANDRLDAEAPARRSNRVRSTTELGAAPSVTAAAPGASARARGGISPAAGSIGE